MALRPSWLVSVPTMGPRVSGSAAPQWIFGAPPLALVGCEVSTIARRARRSLVGRGGSGVSMGGYLGREGCEVQTLSLARRLGDTGGGTRTEAGMDVALVR